MWFRRSYRHPGRSDTRTLTGSEVRTLGFHNEVIRRWSGMTIAGLGNESTRSKNRHPPQSLPASTGFRETDMVKLPGTRQRGGHESPACLGKYSTGNRARAMPSIGSVLGHEVRQQCPNAGVPSLTYGRISC